MCTIHLPDALVEQIAAAGVPSGAVDAFVEQAVREKLAGASRTREEIEQAVDEFDALCEEVAVFAPGAHMTRDQLHERN